MIIGHTAVREQLERELPPVALLLGPESTGKRTLADHLIAHHGVRRWDVIRAQPLSTEIARSINGAIATLPQGPFRVIVIDLDTASEQAQHILLKTLEEPPGAVRFILLASRPVLPTVESRAHVFRCGLLSDSEVQQILEANGIAPAQAAKLAPAGGGQVLAAMASGEATRAKQAVRSALGAVASRSTMALQAALRDWDLDAHRLLGTWAAEAAVERWRVFAPDTAPGLTKVDARVLLAALAAAGFARPHVAAASALGGLLVRK